MPEGMTNTDCGTFELVSRNEDGLVYNKEVVTRILTENKFLSKPVALLSVAGPMRQGKSFLLSVMVCYLEWLEMEEESRPAEWLTYTTALTQFKWRCGSQPDTTGILIYRRPFLIKQADGKELVVLLVDTQGSFDSSSTLDENAKIFGLSTLMSSLQIFNLMRNIREDDLQNLSLFTEIARMDQDDHNSHLQALNFLIRDWPNDDEHPFGFSGGNDFLREKLRVSDEQPSEVNRVRRDLSSCFSSLSCCLLPHPGRNIDNKNKTPIFGEADEQFKQYLQIFVKLTIDSLKPKSFGGRVVLCAEFPLICENLSKFLASDGNSMARNAFEATSQSQYDLAINKAMDVYVREINEVASVYLQTDADGINEKFRSQCSTSNSHAWEIFHSQQKIYVEEIAERSNEKLTQLLQNAYNLAADQVLKVQEAKKNGNGDFVKGLVGGGILVLAIGAGAVAIAAAAPVATTTTATAAATTGFGFMVQKLSSMFP